MSVLQGSVYVAELVADSDLSSATVTCTVTAPDLTVSTVTPTIAGTMATAPITAAQVGTYLVLWSSSGTVVGSQYDQFSVDAAVVDLISLPDLKDELNLRATDTSKDAKLRRWMRAANSVIENITGPIRPYAQTDYFDGGGTTIVLMARWVSAIGSVKENWSGTDYTLTEQPVGASTSAFGYTWDRDTNTLVRRFSGGAPTVFFPGTRNVAVSYTGGLLVIPEDIQMATAELIKHWFRRSQPYRQGPFGNSAGDDTGMDTVGSYMVPNAVMELLETWRRPAGIY